MTLNLKVFVSSDTHDGFGVSSTIIYGEKEAILVDAQFTIANAHRLLADIIETKRELTTIFITHLHPDHFLGVEVIKSFYPNARIVAYEKACDEINNAYDFKIDYWGNTVLKKNGGKVKFPVEKIHEDTFYLEGEEIQIVGLMCGDCIDIAPIWIPSLRALIASDMVFSDAHVWMADMRSEKLINTWLYNLDVLEDLKPKIIVPGHSVPNPSLSPSAIGFTRQYIKDFLKQLSLTKNAVELQSEMERIYPNLPVMICLDYSAKILKDKYVWPGDWPISLRNTPSSLV